MALSKRRLSQLSGNAKKQKLTQLRTLYLQLKELFEYFQAVFKIIYVRCFHALLTSSHFLISSAI
jgi:hypothetical protein